MKWRFAIRYLLARKSHSVINIIASVSLFSVMVPVAAMVILLSVFNGFESIVHDLYKAVDADVEVRLVDEKVLDRESLLKEVASEEGVEACSFVAERQALLRYGDRYATVELRGVDSCYTDVVPLARHTSLGTAAVELGDIDRIMVGEGVAHALGIYAIGVGKVEILSLGGARVGSMLPVQGIRSEEVPLCGLFMIDQQRDSSMAITSLRTLNRLFDCEGETLLVKVAEGVSHREVADALAEKLSTKAEVVLREDKNESFYAIMRYEKWAIFFIALLVLAVASLSIVGTVIMLIVEKRDERPTLYSLGADNRFLRAIFVREGLLISGVGGVAGVVIGVGVVLAQHYFSIVRMPSGFLVESYPVELQWGDVAAVVAAFITIAVAVSIVATHTMIKRNS